MCCLSYPQSQVTVEVMSCSENGKGEYIEQHLFYTHSNHYSSPSGEYIQIEYSPKHCLARFG